MKILFIGNSHTYFNDMPHLCKQMCEALTGEHTEAAMLAYSGRTLRWHRKEYFSIRFALLYGNYDYCVIQQLGHPFPGLEETEPEVSWLVSLCRSCGTKPVLYMTWAKKGESERLPEIASAYRALAEKYNTMLAPVGELFETLRISHPEIELYYRDGAHASGYATYMIAAAFASLLTGQTELFRLPNRTIDFSAQFDELHPKAEENPEKLSCPIDPEIASILNRTVEAMLLRK